MKSRDKSELDDLDTTVQRLFRREVSRREGRPFHLSPLAAVRAAKEVFPELYDDKGKRLPTFRVDDCIRYEAARRCLRFLPELIEIPAMNISVDAELALARSILFPRKSRFT